MTARRVEVLALGETMVLIAPDPPRPLATATGVALLVGGAESNVAGHLASLGRHAAWASRLGGDPFGERILADLTARGVDCSHVERAVGERTACYAKDPGEGATTVHYYRDGSAASRMDRAFAERLVQQFAERPARVVHVSGITPALSAECADLIEAVVVDRVAAPAIVSFDVNFRPGLWSPEDAAPVLARLASAADIVFVGLDEARTLWGCRTPEDVRAVLPGPDHLVVKDGATEAVEFAGGDVVRESALRVAVAEPVGAGDAFAAGWLHAWLDDRPASERLRIGHVLAARVLGVAGDQAALPSATDLAEALAAGDLERLVVADRSSAQQESLDRLFAGTVVMGILRGLTPEQTVAMCETLWAAGVDVIEVPIQDRSARPSFEAAATRARELGRPLGVGTVTTVEQADWALAHGAAFAVAPGFDADVSAHTARIGLPLVPGVATASEIQSARRAGHRWLKAFPASVLGPDWIRAQLAPFPDVAFVATGGVDAANARDFLAAGARIVALGASLARPDVLDALAPLIVASRGGDAAHPADQPHPEGRTIPS